MQRTIALAAIALALAAQVHAAQEVPADLQEAIRLRAQAVAKKDAAVWDRLTTADFTTVLEDGRLQTKAERLTQLKGEKPEALPPPPLAERFSTHGNTVIQRTQGQDPSWIITMGQGRSGLARGSSPDHSGSEEVGRRPNILRVEG